MRIGSHPGVLTFMNNVTAHFLDTLQTVSLVWLYRTELDFLLTKMSCEYRVGMSGNERSTRYVRLLKIRAIYVTVVYSLNMKVVDEKLRTNLK